MSRPSGIRGMAGPLIVLLSAFLSAAGLGVAAETGSNDVPQIRIEYYFEPGCDDCERVAAVVLPRLEAVYSGLYRLERHDLSRREEYVAFLDRMSGFAAVPGAHVYMVVGGVRILAGYPAIEEGLFPCLDELISGALVPVSADSDGGGRSSDLPGRLRSFTPFGVAAAGLGDGLNPCAFSAIVFLVSILAVSGARGAAILKVGASFCAGTFVAYTLIGLGLMDAMYRLPKFGALQRAVDIVLVGVLAALAAVSAFDAWRFSRNPSAASVLLKLPSKLLRRSHGLIRWSVRARGGAAFAAALAGAGVTAIESVCTGQLYLPTIAFVVRGGTERGRAAAYLLLYNVMFVVPLVVVFLAAWRGVASERLSAWARKRVSLAKWLLALLFAALAAGFAAVQLR